MGQVKRRPGRAGWYVVFRDARGKRRRWRVPGNRSEAQDYLERLERQAFDARHRLQTVSDDVEVSALQVAWQAHLKERRRPNSVRSYLTGVRQTLKWVSEWARAARRDPPRVVADLRLRDVEACVAMQADRVSAGTINLHVGALRRMLSWARHQGRIGSNPLKEWVPLKQTDRRRRTALTEFEIKCLLRASPPELRDIWSVFLATGFRAGELMSLTWADVDFERASLRVRAEVAKNHRERFVHMRAEVAAILRRRRLQVATRHRIAAERVEEAEQALGQANTPEAERKARARLAAAHRARTASEGLVFVNSACGPWADGLARWLKRCVKVAGLREDIDLHTLRHTFASHAQRRRVSATELRDLLGHSSIRETNIYTHSLDEDLRRAVESVPWFGDQEVEEAAPKRRPKAL